MSLSRRVTPEPIRIIILDKEHHPVSFEDAQILMEDELDAELQLLQGGGKIDPVAFMNKTLKLLEQVKQQILPRLRER